MWRGGAPIGIAVQEILEYNLRQAGHKVNLASTGQDGLRLAREKRPDLVLLDLMLPDVSGTEVCTMLGISSGNQRLLLHRGRNQLRDILDAAMRKG